MRSDRDCIWCLKRGRKSTEHIVPEVLGCPPGFVLKRGEVCTKCNSLLSPLDAVLAQSFDIFRVRARIPDKKGKPPRITGRSNARGRVSRRGHFELHVNMGQKPVDVPSFGTIPPPAGSDRDVNLTLKQNGTFAEGNMTFSFGGHPDFSRAIHKVAFEWLVKLTSWKQVLAADFDPVRQYVVNNVGHREVLSLASHGWRYYHEFPSRIWHDDDGSPCLEFILCGISFLVALGPSHRAVAKIKEQLLLTYGPTGWAYFPILPNTFAP